jgi:hypothetical protein
VITARLVDMTDVTEDEIRRSGEELIAKSEDPEFAAEYIQGLVELWKQGAIYPVGRNEAGKIVWGANPEVEPR